MAVVEIQPVNNIYSFTGDCYFIAWTALGWCVQDMQVETITSPAKLFINEDKTEQGKRDLVMYVLDWEENLTSP